MSEHKVQIRMKGMEFRPRKGGEYRSGSLQVLDASEAYELVDAKIAEIVKDPYTVPQAPIPYLSNGLESTPVVEEPAVAPLTVDAGVAPLTVGEGVVPLSAPALEEVTNPVVDPAVVEVVLDEDAKLAAEIAELDKQESEEVHTYTDSFEAGVLESEDPKTSEG